MKHATKLMTLMGAAVLGVSTLVPVIGANAATGYTTGTADATTTLPASTSGDKNDTAGTASGTTDAHVTVDTGYLTLIQVPDFNFGVVQPGTNNKVLADNTGLVADDGNSDGILQVNDYRDGTDGAAIGLGYTVTAALGTFAGVADPNGAGAGSSTNVGFKLNLNKAVLSTQVGSSTTPGESVSTALNEGGSGQVLNFAAGNGYGSTVVDYAAKSSATLDVPTQVAKGSYDAPITWTLSAAPGSNN